jgi:hypothetical protein
VNAMPDSAAEIEVVNAYRWALDPRFGRLHVYIDGKKSGVAPLFGSLKTNVPPGMHRVRVRLGGIEAHGCTLMSMRAILCSSKGTFLVRCPSGRG